MKKQHVIAGAILLVMVLGVGLWLGSVMPGWLRVLPFSRSTFGTSTVLQQVQTLSQLVTVKYVMEKVVVLEDVKWYPGGDSRVLMLAHGIVKAGVDLGRIQPEDVTVSGTRVSIRLPPAQITDLYLDDRQTRIIERTTGLLRTFDKDLEQTARQNAVNDIRRAARNAGILKDADERAKTQLTSLFKQMGFEVVEFVP
ncbi:MAG: DUF4230 domain-containing protein [Verrucomicrobiae bacterium]|nr:DUF4230 domain-containing protein [Verrucomicrobiae bacterium]